MKCILAILTVALASQCLAAPVDDEYADLIQAVLTYVKQQLTEHDPMALPDVKNEKIQDENVNLVLSQTNTQLSKASTFTVEDVATDPTTLTATVELNVPQFVQSADYEVSGVAYNRTVSGKGTISVTLVNFDQTIVAAVINPDTSLQISSLQLNYNLDSINVQVEGLNVEGMTAAEVQQFINQIVPNVILNQKAKVEALTAAAVQSKINALIAGKTLQEVVAYVKSLINP